jgi:quercetin dioxygenase-like cupin family protein
MTCPHGTKTSPRWTCPRDLALYGKTSAEAGPVGVWEDLVEAKAKLEVSEAKGRLHVVVVAGDVDATTPGQKPMHVGAWSALVVDDTRVTIEATTRAEIVFAYVPRAEGAKAPHTGSVTTVDFAKVAPLRWAHGSFEARIAIEAVEGSPAPPASLAILRIGERGRVAAHAHDHEWEALHVVQGKGTLTLGEGTDANDYAVEATRTIEVAPARRHAFVAGSDAPFVAVQLYVGPGPEQRFKRLAATAK